MYERLLTWMLNPAFAIFSMVASCRLPFGNPNRKLGLLFMIDPNNIPPVRLDERGANHAFSRLSPQAVFWEVLFRLALRPPTHGLPAAPGSPQRVCLPLTVTRFPAS